MVSGDRTQRRGSRRRDFLKYTGASAATVSLAGCASYGWTPYGPTNSGQEFELPEEVEPDQFEGETFNIGVLAPPKDTSLGASAFQSAEIAVEEINNGNYWLGEALDMEGVLGAELQLKYGNTQLEPAKTKNQFNRLMREEDCVTAFGAAQMRPIMNPMSEVERMYWGTINADPLPRELTSRKISPVGGDPEEEYEKYKYHFSPGPINTLALSQNFIEFLKLYADELGWDRVAFFNENGVESDAFMEFVPPLVREETDVELPIAQVTSGSLTNWTPVWDEVEAEDCDACLVVTLLTGTAAVNQWAAQKRDFELGGIIIQGQLASFFQDTNGAAEATFTMNAITGQARNTRLTEPFLDKYRERYRTSPDGGVPNYMGPITYDAIREWTQGIVETGFHPVQHVDELIPHYESEDFVFTHGTTWRAHGFRPPDDRFAHDAIWDCMTLCEGEFDDNDPHGPTGLPVWQQWQKNEEGRGVQEIFRPEVMKTADHILPPWMR